MLKRKKLLQGGSRNRVINENMVTDQDAINARKQGLFKLNSARKQPEFGNQTNREQETPFENHSRHFYKNSSMSNAPLIQKQETARIEYGNNSINSVV